MDYENKTTKRFADKDSIIAKAIEVESRHTIRRSMHELDHSLWRLDEYVLDELKFNTTIKKGNYPSFTSNSPRTLSRVVSAMLNKNAMKYRITLPPDVSETEEDTINSNERLVLGGLYEVDRKRTHNDENTLQWALTWYIIHRGGVSLLPLWTPDDKRDQWKVLVFDPYDCAWDRGSCCLDFFVRHYVDEKSAVEADWGVTNLKADANDMVEVWDCWWVDKYTEEYPAPEGEIAEINYKDHAIFNAVYTGGEWVKEPTEHPEFPCNPVRVIRSGGSPSDSNMKLNSNTNALTDQWESLYTGVRETIGWINRAVTLFGLYLRNGAIGPYIYKGRKNKNIEQGLQPFKVIKIDQGEDFGPTTQPQMANEAKEFLGFVKSEFQKAGVSDIVFGDIPFTVSGFGMIQLRGAVEVLISSFIKATERAYVAIAEEWTSQFVKIGGNKKINVKGLDNRNKAFMDSIRPKDITREYVIQATLNEGLPTDPVQIGNAANQWKAAGAPTKEIFEKVFQFEDSAELARQALKEQAEQLPPVLLTKALMAFVREGDMDSARLLAALIEGSGGGGNAANPQSAEGADVLNPTSAAPFPQNQPPELAGGTTEQGGNFPTEATGRPARGGY